MAKRVLTVLAVLILAVAGAGAAVIYSKMPAADQVARGVYLETVPLGGLLRPHAEQALADYFRERLNSKLTLVCEEKQWEYTLQELGVEGDAAATLEAAMRVGHQGDLLQRVAEVLRVERTPVHLSAVMRVDEQKLRKVVELLAPQVTRQAKNATLDLGEDDKVVHNQAVIGRSLDSEAAIEVVKAAALGPALQAVSLPLELTQPEITDQMVGPIDTLLSKYSTSFATSKRNRASNIRLGAGLLSHRIIQPGEVFSFNAAVGPRTVERGFKEAPTYNGGRIVPGIGGGTCQLSTTTYNAVLLAGLEVVMRRSHSMRVTYVPPGRDATVVWGSDDLRFRNPFKHPICIFAGTKGSEVWVAMAGNKADKREVRLESKVLGSIPFKEVMVDDDALDPGSQKVEQGGVNGLRSELYETVKGPDGKDATRLVSRDTYSPTNRIVRRGPGAEEKPLEIPPSLAIQEGG